MVGIACGIVYALGSICQQWGLYFTTAGKTGFITTLYTIFVPLISWVFLKRKVKKQIWIGAVFAVAGLFFISAGNGFHLSVGDTIVFVGAVFFAIQILLTSHFVQYNSVLLLNVIQLAIAATISLIVSFLFEQGNSLKAIMGAADIILYSGVVCIGVAYLLQGLALKKAAPSIAAIILSFESVFGAVFGAIILKERMSGSQLFGCALIFTAIIVAQYERGVLKAKTE
jgi:drug/metabolite transporter (DMT)-like permease